MKYLLLFFLIPFLSASECGKKKNKKENDPNLKTEIVIKDSLNTCLRKIIDDVNKDSPIDVPIQIDEYLYNGEKVFLLTAPCCDNFNMLYDDSCKLICAPTGGFSGRGDGKCPEFSKQATLIKTIWKAEAK